MREPANAFAAKGGRLLVGRMPIPIDGMGNGSPQRLGISRCR
jgi:hypothetical protein